MPIVKAGSCWPLWQYDSDSSQLAAVRQELGGGETIIVVSDGGTVVSDGGTHSKIFAYAVFGALMC
jgi:hypothetical protein